MAIAPLALAISTLFCRPLARKGGLKMDKLTRTRNSRIWKQSKRKALRSAGILIFSAILTTPILAHDVSIDDLANDSASTSDVLMNGLGWNAQRFSPLNSINTETVSSLVPAWALSFGGEK